MCILTPDAHIYSTDAGVREYDMTVRIVRGVAPWDGLESDIRARYYAGATARRWSIYDKRVVFVADRAGSVFLGLVLGAIIRANNDGGRLIKRRVSE